MHVRRFAASLFRAIRAHTGFLNLRFSETLPARRTTELPGAS